MLFKEINWNGLRSVNERAGEGLRFWTPGSRDRYTESLRRKSFAGQADRRVMRAADTGQGPPFSPQLRVDITSQLRLLDVSGVVRAPASPATAPSVVCAAFNPRRKSSSVNVVKTSVG